MTLPSMHLLLSSAGHIIKRFPFVLLTALVCTGIGIYLVHHTDENDLQRTLIRVMMSGSLGLPLFFSLHILTERYRLPVLYRMVAIVIGLGLLVQFYYSIPDLQTDVMQVVYRFVFWSAGLHLVAAFSAFFAEEEIHGFWQFNKMLFLRFLTSGLYSGVLFIGLSGALLAIDSLFSVVIDGETYGDLFMVLAGVFNTMFFLGGIQQPLDRLNEEDSYPKGLKIFTQYVLIPLVTIYLVILYAYMGKILIQMSLPKGWVANLILGFSVTGILSLLLVYPLREHEDNKWIKTFSRFFYFSLVPLVVMLFVAIGIRITEYGVTIERYIVAMLGTWLAVITLYFIFSKKKNIILIPLTLSLFLFGSCFGPWGMFSVSERSQLKRLRALLETNGAFAGGKIVPLSETAMQKMKAKDGNQMSSIIDYLGENHGFEGLKDWLPEDCQKTVFADSIKRERFRQNERIRSCIGLRVVSQRYSDDKEGEMKLDFNCDEYSNLKNLTISGFDRIYEFNEYQSKAPVKTPGDSTVAASPTGLNKNKLEVMADDKAIVSYQLDSFAMHLKSLPTKSQTDNNATAAKDMTIETTNSNGDLIKLVFGYVECTYTDTSVRVNNVRGYALVKKQ